MLDYVTSSTRMAECLDLFVCILYPCTDYCVYERFLRQQFVQPFESPPPRVPQTFDPFLDVFVKRKHLPVKCAADSRFTPSRQHLPAASSWAVGPMIQIWSGGKRARLVGLFDVGQPQGQQRTANRGPHRRTRLQRPRALPAGLPSAPPLQAPRFHAKVTVVATAAFR